MKQFIKEAMNLFEEIEKIDMQVSSSVNGKMSQIDENSEKLAMRKSEVFHSVFAKYGL